MWNWHNIFAPLCSTTSCHLSGIVWYPFREQIHNMNFITKPFAIANGWSNNGDYAYIDLQSTQLPQIDLWLNVIKFQSTVTTPVMISPGIYPKFHLLFLFYTERTVRVCICNASLIARFMGPTWGPSGADRTQVGPMLASWTLLSGLRWWLVNGIECVCRMVGFLKP